MKRRILVPGTNKHRIIGGCKLPRHAPQGFKLKDFLTLPPAPAMCDYSAAAITVIQDIEGNDDYGDCCIAEDAHNVAVTTGNSGNGLFSYTRTQTLSDYSVLTGFNAADPTTDQGTDPIANLNWRVSHGYADGSKDAGWALVDATNKNEVAYAVAEFGTIKMWFGIPDSIVQNMPTASGFVWDVTAGANNPNNGHCVGSCGFNVTKILVVGVTAQGLLIYTWGMLGIITWAAVAAWFAPVNGGGMAVRVTTDWVNKTSGNAPSGLNLAALINAFNSYFGGKLPVPTPPGPVPTPPGPTPTPPKPAPVVTLAEAQAWATGPQGLGTASLILTRSNAGTLTKQGLAKNWPVA